MNKELKQAIHEIFNDFHIEPSIRVTNIRCMHLWAVIAEFTEWLPILNIKPLVLVCFFNGTFLPWLPVKFEVSCYLSPYCFQCIWQPSFFQLHLIYKCCKWRTCIGLTLRRIANLNFLDSNYSMKSKSMNILCCYNQQPQSWFSQTVHASAIVTPLALHGF